MAPFQALGAPRWLGFFSMSQGHTVGPDHNDDDNDDGYYDKADDYDDKYYDHEYYEDEYNDGFFL